MTMYEKGLPWQWSVAGSSGMVLPYNARELFRDDVDVAARSIDAISRECAGRIS